MKDLIERLRHGYPSKERLEAADAIHALTTENTRLTECLRISNNNHEAFERKWYLATDENAQLKAELASLREQKPVAWGMENNGLILDIICPDEHDRYEGEYLTPLYAAPGAIK